MSYESNVVDPSALDLGAPQAPETLVTPTVAWQVNQELTRLASGLGLASLYGLALGARGGGLQLLRHALGAPLGLLVVAGVGYTASVTVIMARESDLETALLNLLDNAQRFSPEGKAVSLLVSGPGHDSWLSLRVVDEGPGILPEHVPRVFERFFTTDADRDGTGLGLAIVKSVASAHGGSISFTSEPGRGTCFELRLPTDFRRQTAARR